jgi:hypothetical protein
MVRAGESLRTPDYARWTPKHGSYFLQQNNQMVKISDNKLIIEIEASSPCETWYDLQRSLLHLLMLKDLRQNTDGVAEWHTISCLMNCNDQKLHFKKHFARKIIT